MKNYKELVEKIKSDNPSLEKKMTGVAKDLSGSKGFRLHFETETLRGGYFRLKALLGKVEVGTLLVRDLDFAGDSLEILDPSGIFKEDTFYKIAVSLIKGK